MTGTEARDAILSHIGDRTTGRVGTETPQVSALTSLNFALEVCVEDIEVEELVKKSEVSLTTSNYQYDLPTSDTDSNTIKVKQLGRAVMKQTSATSGIPLYVLPIRLKKFAWPIMDSTRTGRPFLVSKVGEQLWFYPWPNDTYTIELLVDVWPERITSSSLGSDLPLNREWDKVVIAWGVHDMFAKLQQVEDSKLWESIFIRRKRSLVGTLRKRPDQVLDGTLNNIPFNVTANFARDPFAGR